MSDHDREADLRALVGAIRAIYRQVDILHQHRPDRHFTPDGHLVGSIGEVYAEYLFDLKQHPASYPIHDAVTPDGRQVQVKATQIKSITPEMPSTQRPEHHVPVNLIVLTINLVGIPEVVYAGPGKNAVEGCRPISTLTYRQIRLPTLRRIYSSLDPALKIPQIREFPTGDHQ